MYICLIDLIDTIKDKLYLKDQNHTICRTGTSNERRNLTIFPSTILKQQKVALFKLFPGSVAVHVAY